MREKAIAQLRVAPGSSARLDRRDPADKLGLSDKVKAEAEAATLFAEFDDLHNRLWAEATRSVLLVLQGMDTSGKDGTIRRVLSGLNPQGCEVTSFKAPSETERAHEYLWRVHAVCPARGKLGVFNRSHYEDVLAARVLGIVDADECRRRFRQIVEWERMLTEEGTTLVKVCLHLSKDEQRKRLEERLHDPKKQWKFKVEDLDTRKHWADYQAAYEESITATSSAQAPWYVVPADRKWVRDVAVVTLLVATFRQLDPQIPPPHTRLENVAVD
ncbi:MAG: polyphosphate kinase 2 family protein [Actinobacteria bacterium]|nr:MAG: polyphosphate kinase 2 family protein [Actinomycetota bacterium]